MAPAISFAKAVNDALFEALKADTRVICYGLGVPDPKGVFGTTLGLQEHFGVERVFDMPASENAMTGVAIGAALGGLRPVMTHQRLDFFLLALDELVNSAAKWHYMFGGKSRVPVTIRLIIGRGWGQGPTHSQSLQAWFAHIPGLKVVMPALPADAKGLLLSSIFDDNPVVYLEHRWLHNLTGLVPDGDYRCPLGKAAVLREGSDLTIVAASYMVIEALNAEKFLHAKGLSVEVIDLRTIAPVDWDTVFASVNKTRRVLILDTGNLTGSFSGEIAARIAKYCWERLRMPPERMALPDYPSPTSPALTEKFYPGAVEIAEKVGEMLGLALNAGELGHQPHDVPGESFKGPF